MTVTACDSTVGVMAAAASAGRPDADADSEENLQDLEAEGADSPPLVAGCRAMAATACASTAGATAAAASAGRAEADADNEENLQDLEAAGADSDEEGSGEEVAAEVWDSGDKDVFEPGLEWWQASFTLVVVVVGAGVMALPQVPLKGGVVVSGIALLVCGVTITEAGLAMWKGIMAANKGSSPDKKNVVSYEDFGRASFGSAGESAVTAMIIINYVGICSSFQVLIAEEVRHLLGDVHPVKMVLLWLSPAFALLSLIPNVTTIAKLAPLAVIAIVVLCSTIVLKSVMAAEKWQAWPDLDASELHRVWPTSALACGPVISILFGSFSVNGNVPSVVCEMKDPTRFPLALKSAMVAVAAIYMAVMGAGYYGFGQFTQPDIVDSLTYFPANQAQAFGLPMTQWTGGRSLIVGVIMSSVLLVKLLIGLPLNLMVVVYSFQTFKYTKAYFPKGSIPNKLMRLSIVGTAVLIGLVVSDFSQLFALVCSLCGPFLQVLMPLIFSFKVRGTRSVTWRRMLHAAMLLIAAFTFTIGTYQSLVDIVDSD